jgi:glycosyltransferase involved in cell wall biosynthesis
MEQDSPSSNPLATGTRPTAVNWRGRRARPAGEDAARLLVVSHDAYPAGAQLILLENVRHWASDPTLDVRVVLLGPGKLENDFAALCPTVCTEDMRPAAPEDALRSVLADLARDDWRADAAFCNSAASAAACEIIARAGVPVVSAVYELPTSIESELGGRRTVQRIVKSASAVIVASAFVRDRLAEAYALDAARLTPLHTGVLRRAWPDRATARASIRAELGVPPETVIVLGCGSIHHRKGTDLFVTAAARARAAGLDVPNVFAWVGQDQRGATFRTWCEHDADRLGVRDIVRLVGPRDDPAPWFAGSDIFAMTSREDPFPMVNLEALANGLGVVAFDNAGGAGEVLRPDRGVVVPYLDVDAMGAAIARLVGDPAELEALRRRADAFARDHLGWERYMRDIRAVLAGVAPAFGQKAGVRA